MPYFAYAICEIYATSDMCLGIWYKRTTNTILLQVVHKNYISMLLHSFLIIK